MTPDEDQSLNIATVLIAGGLACLFACFGLAAIFGPPPAERVEVVNDCTPCPCSVEVQP